ncbi:cilia- and flagella-associated protein 300-like [Saccoglossus kowalevskii]|uniref:Cilia- and flagella-associated protein 300 n=1 Tax=Saccoglossus kowalevskii TaxID=10224 RepID=A0ABM0MJ61_SACKO|nr:PREDICTED: uncharacterized protein C11orf70 homolog [Saccoglossus kowalevskii]
MAESAGGKFSFSELKGKKCSTLESKDTQDLLMKWDLKGKIKTQYYSYDKHFQSYQKDDFFLDFFQDPTVISTLQVVSSSGSWAPLGMAAEKVSVQSIRCSILSMTFFDRLHSEGILRENDQIHKCFDEYCEGFQISDELRKMLLMEDSDNYEAYSDEEREEFLFHLFKHICLGGPVCQFEDNAQPYLDTTKSLYKDLISVQKDPESKELKIISQVFLVKAMDKDNFCIYPDDKEHEQTFCYVIIDPIKRQLTVCYHRWGSSIW